MASRFSQPVALITGASRGIGRGIALRLANEGYAAIVNYVRNRDLAENVVAEIEAGGGTAVAIQADVGIQADRQRLVEETLAKFGRLDVLVNNAGITSPGRLDILEATEEGRVALRSLRGLLRVSGAPGADIMVRRGGETLTRHLDLGGR